MSAEQVESELRKNRSAIDDVSSAEPRTVTTLEAQRPLVARQRGASGAAQNTPTPYSSGKASLSAGSSVMAAQQRITQRPAEPTQAKAGATARLR
ncbi:MAG: hypothetical protein EON54_02495 [Alcaligenaceae bacterium]|nr:MAG: hypothetical protein EON54_02495 [Alcaligenaceae bacterium]